MAAISVRNVRLAGGAAAGVIAASNLMSGGTFRVPGFTDQDIWGVWVPAVTAVAALMPGTIPQSRTVAGAGLAAIGIKRVFLDGQTDFTIDNLWRGYLPLAAGVWLLVG